MTPSLASPTPWLDGSSAIMTRWAVEPIYPLAYLGSCALLCAAFYTAHARQWLREGKQRAWILTVVAAGIMSLASLPYLVDLARHGGDVGKIAPRPYLSKLAVLFFQAYLSCDMALGFLHYRKYMNISTGWGHHSCYFALLFLVLHRGWATIFTMASILELPTLILGLGCMQPRLRSDRLFAVSFAALRLGFHAWLILTFLPSWSPGARHWHSIGPGICLALAYPMHMLWFYACVKGMRRRAAKRRAEAKAAIMAHAQAQANLKLQIAVQELSAGKATTASAGSPEELILARFARIRAKIPENISEATKARLLDLVKRSQDALPKRPIPPLLRRLSSKPIIDDAAAAAAQPGRSSHDETAAAAVAAPSGTRLRTFTAAEAARLIRLAKELKRQVTEDGAVPTLKSLAGLPDVQFQVARSPAQAGSDDSRPRLATQRLSAVKAALENRFDMKEGICAF